MIEFTVAYLQLTFIHSRGYSYYGPFRSRLETKANGCISDDGSFSVAGTRPSPH